jgi:hypothetical protein
MDEWKRASIRAHETFEDLLKIKYRYRKEIVVEKKSHLNKEMGFF